MLLRELRDLVDGTGNAAFAVRGGGEIIAWNSAAEALFGVRAEEALGKSCWTLFQGCDDAGTVCSQNCVIAQAIAAESRMADFDLLARVAGDARRWCNITTLIARVRGENAPVAIHVARDVDVRKRLERLVCDFVVRETGLSAEDATTAMESPRSAARGVRLSVKEKEVLRRLAKGATTAAIGAELRIRVVTVRNHIQHLMAKLGAHSRLEAIRRAEAAKLL